ncbi:MAG TPA: hypothetical protein VE990_04110 [Acidimicrobiales bacterium]|nr:hypothetical protein [Acidimicrobiales bacterium]
MSALERHDRSLAQRVVPATVSFFVVAGGIYATAWLALAVLRHVIMPVVALVVGFYVARMVFRATGSRD